MKNWVLLPFRQFFYCFSAKVFVILICCWVYLGKLYNNKCVYICSNSQAVLLALNKTIRISHILWECYFIICHFAAGNRASLLDTWAFRCCRYWGGSWTSKKSSVIPFVGPEPDIRLFEISNNHTRTTCNIFKKKQYLKEHNIKSQ